MLHPKTQPGAKLDYEYPPETVTIVLKGADMDFATDNSPGAKILNRKGTMQVTMTPNAGQWFPIELTVSTGHKEPKLELTWFTAEDPRPRAMPLRRFFMPWVTPKAPEIVGPRRVPELAGGDWQRGKQIFLSEQAACSKCHQVRGEGGKIGPDLSSLTQRDYASVLKDILEPSAAINPDHLAYNVELKDAEAVTGVILDDTPAQVVLGQVTGQTTSIPRQRIKSMKPSSVSLMPEGLLKGLTAQQQTDLLTFLLMEAPDAAK
jgi:putative heme-binding domain-containing protein